MKKGISVIFRMVCRLALRYSCGNDAARDELIDFGLLALHEFLLKHEEKLTLELFETGEFKVKLYNYLWSKIGHEAEKLSRRSPVFCDFNLKAKFDEIKETGSKVQFFGYICDDTDSDSDDFEADFFESNIVDERNSYDIGTIEIFCDIKRLLSNEEYTLFVKYYNGSTLAVLSKEYAVSIVAIKKRLDKIRKKLKPLAESIKAA